MSFSKKEIFKKLPKHLHQFIATQDYDLYYNAQDQAVWRYVMRQLSHQLKSSAHPIYNEGLEKTGISIEKIPSIEEMNKCLNKLGWMAIVVDGFIPPQAFMELQALKVLAIALEMRSLEHILYTPAPDIVHESAGHAPMVYDAEYSVYLQRFGEIGVKAMFTKQDKEVYEAIRHLSIIKGYPSVTKEEIKQAEEDINNILNSVTVLSESALLTRLHWWTVEYGLVGTVDNYTIYGAGLLSSLSESKSCLDDEKVKKTPLTVDAVNTPYDITNPQPQLFVTKSCRHLTQVLEDFADQMCFRKGGAESVQVAIDSEIISTCEYSSGLQVSGLFTRLLKNSVNKEIYIGTTGPTQISVNNKELDGHGISYHTEGFGSPVGPICNLMIPLEDATEYDLITLNIKREYVVHLEFVSGIEVIGVLKKIHKKLEKNVLMTFENCTVTGPTGDVLFQPEWGIYDMAVGIKISSVFSGSADKTKFDVYPSKSEETAKKIKYSDKEKFEFLIYNEIRSIRETGKNFNRLKEIITLLKNKKFESWLLFLEILELLEKGSKEYKDVRNALISISKINSKKKHLIDRGLNILDSE
tara:strand:- start:118 stop:1863 length:1746 start_codon:yes stop_codon:yes gene_type:complete